MCNWRKSLKLFGQTSEIANIIINQDSSTRFLFVTFTVKNCDADKLSQTIDMMNMGFKRLTDKSKGVKITEKFKNNMLGYMRAIEVTYNQQEDTYHPHIHCIFAVKAQYFTHGYIKNPSGNIFGASVARLNMSRLFMCSKLKIAHQRQLQRLLNIRSKLMI